MMKFEGGLGLFFPQPPLAITFFRHLFQWPYTTNGKNQSMKGPLYSLFTYLDFVLRTIHVVFTEFQ